MRFLQSSFRRMSSLLAVVLAVSVLSFSGRPSINKPSSTDLHQSRRPKHVAGEVLIKMKHNLQLRLGKMTGVAVATGIASLDKVLNRFQGEKLALMFPNHTGPTRPGGVDLTQFYRFHYRDGSDPRSVAKVLQSTGAIEYAEPHYIRYVDFTPNDTYYGQQWHLKKTKADSAWDVTEGDSSIIIGIIDTGVQWDHPDLKQNIWHNPHPGQNPNFPADSIGWDFGGLDGTPDNNPDEDRADHGTAIAGIASAVTNNGTGVAGVGFKSKVMAVKTSQDNSRSTPTSPPYIAYGYEGMVYAADNGAAVINASWGGPGYSQLEQDVINYVTSKGALVVAAAGNSGTNEPFYPAGYAHVLGVAATDSTDRRADWGGGQSSNYGPRVRVSAPGTDVFSTWKQSIYAYLSGTSPSTPIVSGTAALIKSLHPSWTPDQIAEQIRVTADPIDNLNPGYEKQLGLGRVNVFRAVTDTSSPGLQMTSFTLSDSIGGNNDGSLDPGETIRLVGQFTNLLRPAFDASVTLSTSDPYIVITNAVVGFFTIGTLQTATNDRAPLAFQIRSDIPENHKAVLYVNLYERTYAEYTGFTVLLNPTYKDHNINNITMTVTSKGTLGFNDYHSNLQGTGFVFNQVDEGNILFEGAFMAGTDVAHIVDEARGDDQDFQDSAFVPQVRFSFPQQSRVSNQDGFSLFTDDSAGANKIGLRISLNTFAFKNAPDNDYIILKYTLRNTTSVAISTLYVGLYFDWDVGSVGLNIATYDPSRHLGYVYDTDPNGSKTYAGAVLLSTGSPQFRAIDNDNTVSGNPWGVYDGFTKAEKWQSLSGGTTHAQEGPSDVSTVIGTGPLSIAANDSALVGLAVLAGLDLQSLQASADAAKQKWNVILTEVQRISSELPLTFSLYQNYPNPFNPSTKIRYDLPSESQVTLVVYNLLGQEVARLVDTRQDAGKYEVPFVASNVSSGVYFYRIQAGAYSEIKKMMILR